MPVAFRSEANACQEGRLGETLEATVTDQEGQRFLRDGEMAEWLKAAVLKTVKGNSLPGFESLSLRQFE